MNKKTPIIIAMILGTLIGLMCGYTFAPNTKRIAIDNTSKATVVMLSEEAWEWLEEILDQDNWP